MEKVVSKIVFRQTWNNLVDLPSHITGLLYNASVSPQEVIVEILQKSQHKCYIGWSGMNSNSTSVINIDPLSAHAVGLTDNESVTISVKLENFKSTKIMLEPETFFDWELVELHAAYIESKLIEQSRCVAVDQSIIIYPTRTSSVRLNVKDIGVDSHFAIIDPFAEVIISPKVHEKKASAKSLQLEADINPLDGVFPSPSLLKRGVPLKVSIDSDFDSANIGYSIYGNLKEFTTFSNSEFVSVSIFSGPNLKSNSLPSSQRETSKTTDKTKPTAVFSQNKRIVANLIDQPAISKDTVALSEKLALALNVSNSVGYKVILKPAPRCMPRKPSAIIVHPYIPRGKKTECITRASLKETHAEFVNQTYQIFLRTKKVTDSPVTNFCKLPVIPKILPFGGIVNFKKNLDPQAWFKVSQDNFSNQGIKIEVGEPIMLPLLEVQSNCAESEPEEMYGIDSVINDLIFQLSAFRSTGIMVHGTQGSGKTAVLKVIEKKLEQKSNVFSRLIACETLMNEGSDQIRMKITKWLNEAVWKQPSILLIDNADKILSAEVENTDSHRSNQLTEQFVSSIRSIFSQKGTSISVVLTGSSKESFNKLILQSHLIEKFINLGPPDKLARAAILENYMSKNLKCVLAFDLMDIVLETEGYLPNDLKVLSDRMYYESVRHFSSNSPPQDIKINSRDFKSSLNGFEPSSLRGVKLEKSGTHWEDIGGMDEAKRILLETLEWPTKYAPIFANCPLRLRSGLLLYGYPGCGKTLLASAIAGQCGLNFISIKGPQILNKYIGASEQSVRELFERAQSAKPCILFFDEFDSIAPKRGHDSTGVTDRVVNQILTQMDGAEGLDGVYVLAATSRPDLIDSALLRPGRLDKSILCDLPNYRDRLSILTCICKKMNILAGFKLEDIASQTEGFSGADLQGLGYNAYLKAVHDKLSNDEKIANGNISGTSPGRDFFILDSKKTKNKIRPSQNIAVLQQIEAMVGIEKKQEKSIETDAGSNKTQVWINSTHFMASLKESKLSISATEKAKLSRVYSEFQTGRDGNMPDGNASQEIGGRTTLM